MRLTEAEQSRVREMASRLGSSEAAVIRYAIRSMLNRVAPLYDPSAKGFSLIPVFVECGAELTSYFDLDVQRLERIINGEAVNGDAVNGREPTRVEKEDLALLAMSGLKEPQVHAKLREMQQKGVEQDDVPRTLRSYFYDKYIYQSFREKDGD